MLFMGIALLVYYVFFKVLGIILFAVEMTVFIAGPVVKEMKDWCVFGEGKVQAPVAFDRRSNPSHLCLALFPLERSGDGARRAARLR